MAEVMDDSEIKIEFLERLEAVRTLDLPEGKYLIWGSGPLAVRGLRPAGDVDLVVSRDLWDDLSKVYPVDGKRIVIGEIEVWSDLLNLTDRLDQVIVDCDWIEGLPFMKLSYVVEWKRVRGSEKDLADIELIDRYLFAALSPL